MSNKMDLYANDGADNTTNGSVQNVTNSYSLFQKTIDKSSEIKDKNLNEIFQKSQKCTKEYISKGNECKQVKSSEELMQWSLTFRRFASNTYDDDLQTIWAHILSAKVTGRASTSARAMDVVSKLSKEEALLFKKVAQYAIMGRSSEYFLPSDLIDSNSDEMLQLHNCGLLSVNSCIIEFTVTGKKRKLFSGNKYGIWCSAPHEFNLKLDVLKFTNAGSELLDVLSYETDLPFMKSFVNQLKKEHSNFNFSLHEIVYQDGETFFDPKKDLMSE